MDCKLVLVEGRLQCANGCGQPLWPPLDENGKPRWLVPDNPNEWPHINCTLFPGRHHGTGDHLHSLIRKYFGEEATLTCGCGQIIEEMNALGPAGVRERLDHYVTHLLNQANERGWWKMMRKMTWRAIFEGAKGATVTPKSYVTRMALKACKMAERDIIKHLGETFDRVIVLNLAHDTERMEKFKAETTPDRWPFKQPERFEAVDGSRLPLPEKYDQGGGAFGCIQSHLHILEKAIIDGVSSILVLEDDLILADDFTRKVTDFMVRCPGSWDGLFLGGQHSEEPQPIRDGVVRCMNTQRTHAYAMRPAMMRATYKLWTEALNAPYGHADWLLGPTCKQFHVYAPDPLLAGQRNGKSNIAGRESPTKFWIPPPADQPFLLLHCPKEILPALRERGFHTGYQRQLETDIDVGLVEWAAAPEADRPNLLRKWIEMLAWECGSDPALLAIAWHPNLTMDMMRNATEWPLYEVTGTTVDDVLSHLPSAVLKKWKGGPVT